MNGSSIQLEELMAKSRQVRIEFLRTEVEACFSFAKVAETERQTGHDEAASRSIEHAEEAYTTLTRFLSDPKHAKHITDEDHRELTAAMERLREELDRLRP
jgi:hypothetical protein